MAGKQPAAPRGLPRLRVSCSRNFSRIYIRLYKMEMRFIILKSRYSPKYLKKYETLFHCVRTIFVSTIQAALSGDSRSIQRYSSNSIDTFY